MIKLNAAVAAILITLLFAAAAPVAAAEAGRQPWQQLYAGEEATGPNVIGLWQFLPGQETKDNSGRKHDLVLQGQARFVKEGPLGAALESFPASTENDKAQGVLTRDADDLSPAGAFTLEAWFAAKPEMEQSANVFLLDKKLYNYAKDLPQANWDYCLYMPRSGVNKRRLTVSLGFGTDSAFVTGPEIDTTPGQWRHVAFTYDGAGLCRFFIDGKLMAKVPLEGRGAITPGTHPLTIGDRIGSVHTGFPGYVAQVRISNGIVPYFTGGLTIGVGRGRSAFVRMEKNVTLSLALGNDMTTPFTKGRAQVLFGNLKQDIALPDLASNEEFIIPVKVNTALRPDDYSLKVSVSGVAAGQNLKVEKELPISIVARPLPNQMPVVMWGTGDLERLKSIGFTHDLRGLADEAKIWKAGAPTEAMSADQIENQGKLLDQMLKMGLSAAVYLHPGTWVTRDPERKAKYNRVDRTGAVREHDNVCGNFREVRDYCYNVGASVAQTFGKFPALNASLVHSEVRDGSDLCFHDHDKALFREFAGYDIPAEVEGKNGLRYTRIKNFPTNRVIKDDDRILKFYTWFWKDGDGWNPLHSQVHRGLKSTGRKDLWTFFDPAVRVPDVWGSGGDVDMVSQWTYSYPDPIKIGQATDELFAMADGKPGQQVMKMTQIIWYRSGTAPKLPEDEAKRASWERKIPDAQFITIAPDHLREAFWSKLSRPIQGIMYHGWESLTDTGRAVSYRYTHPQTQRVLAELVRTVVRPLGPTLLQVPDRPSDFGVLESFTSQIFAGRGTHGWSQGWEADLHLILQWAQIQPKVLYEETILRDGLEGCRVLALPFCDVLPEGVARRIAAFQRAGGLLIADEYLTPALTPDIVVPSYQRTGKAREDKRVVQARAANLCRELDQFYTRYGESANPDVVVRFRRYRHCDYLFAVNDRRTFGDYVGHHGLAMEKGLPTTAALTVRRPAGHVYDLVAHRPVPVRAAGGALRFTARFGPGDGRLFLIAPTPIRGVRVAAPARASRGGAVRVEVTVVDPRGAAVPAVVPVQVEVLDPRQRPAEPSGYYGAKDGKLSFTLDLAPNDLPGRWVIRARELASGSSGARAFTVAR